MAETKINIKRATEKYAQTQEAVEKFSEPKTTTETESSEPKIVESASPQETSESVKKPAQSDNIDSSDKVAKNEPELKTSGKAAENKESDKKSKPKTIEEQLKDANEDAENNRDMQLRLSAEFDNFKKRCARENADFKKFANETLITEILPILDNLERAIESCGDIDESNKGLIEGVDLTHKGILNVFEKFGVTRIDAVNKTFDPAYHQAVMREETDDHPGNTVINEFQKGYLLHDRLVRPSMVVVSVPKTSQTQDDITKE